MMYFLLNFIPWLSLAKGPPLILLIILNKFPVSVLAPKIQYFLSPCICFVYSNVALYFTIKYSIPDGQGVDLPEFILEYDFIFCLAGDLW